MFGANFDAAYSPSEGRSPHLWFVMGLVIERSSHGYEIVQRYDARFGWLLPISSASVYEALKRLRHAGLLEEVPEEGPVHDARSRGRRRLRATRAGAEAYRGWLAGQMRDNPQRFALLGRLDSTTVLGVRGAIDVLERFESECIRELKDLPLLDERVSAGECDAAELARWLAVDHQRRALRADLDWAADARKTVLLYADRRGGQTEG